MKKTKADADAADEEEHYECFEDIKEDGVNHSKPSDVQSKTSQSAQVLVENIHSTANF